MEEGEEWMKERRRKKPRRVGNKYERKGKETRRK